METTDDLRHFFELVVRRWQDLECEGDDSADTVWFRDALLRLRDFEHRFGQSFCLKSYHNRVLSEASMYRDDCRQLGIVLEDAFQFEQRLEQFLDLSGLRKLFLLARLRYWLRMRCQVRYSRTLLKHASQYFFLLEQTSSEGRVLSEDDARCCARLLEMLDYPLDANIRQDIECHLKAASGE